MTGEIMRWVETGLWLAILVVTTKPVWRLLFGTPRRLDAIWAMVWFGTSNRLLFNAIVLFMPDSNVARDAAHVMAMMVATVVLLARWAKAGEP